MAKETIQFSVDGTKELENALFELPKATSKNVGRRALIAGAEPMLSEFKSRAPRLTGYLIDRSGISTKLSKRQRSEHKAEDDRDNVEMFVGAGPGPQAVQQEFGNKNHPAQPSLTPAFEGNKYKAVEIIGETLWKEIQKAAARLARKAARLGRNGG